MLKNKIKLAFTVMGTVVIPLVAQADQSMNSEQAQQAYVPGSIVKTGQLPAGYNTVPTKSWTEKRVY